MAEERKSVDAGMRCTWGLICLALCLFLSLSLFSYDWRDIIWRQAPPNSPPSNSIGPVGAWVSFFLFNGFGVGAYLIPALCLVLGLLLLWNRQPRLGLRVVLCAVVFLSVSALPDLRPGGWDATCHRLNIVGIGPGGVFGWIVVREGFVRWLSPVGTAILIGIVLTGSLLLLVGLGNATRVAQWAGARGREWMERFRAYRAEREDRRQRIEKEKRDLEKQQRRLEKLLERQPPAPAPVSAAPEALRPPAPPPPEKPAQPPPRREAPPAPPPREEPEEEEIPREEERREPPPSEPYELPPTSLLSFVPTDKSRGIETDTTTTAKILVETLAEFGIETQVTNVERGPVVTRYELLPAPGIRVERIAGLSNNLALSLKATSVRVQAPIPGKGVVGIEVPNSVANMVSLREVLEGDLWKSGKAKLPLVLGKDVSGNDLVADLADMPHLLIAGATGSGKTVCMNSVLAGLLMARSPAELRLLLVDPKIVEFSVYNHLPHLAAPVVTNPKKVALALRWAINEMEKRYKLFAKAGVRNIETYNRRDRAKQAYLFGEPDGEPRPEEEAPDRVPYIVIVVDELADLMLADQAEIENAIARLAQLSRAVGIHMILSTQRPSVNVITGTIKANFPARIAFQVAQKVDSRTILDTVGAEKLLGRGDMLFMPPGTSKLVRAQGAASSDDDIQKLVAFITRQAEPAYELQIKESTESAAGKMDDSVDDELLQQATNIIRETRRASTSSLQRRLRIGYTRAARIMDILEERGIVGPPRGSDPREILIDLDGEIPANASADAADEAEPPEAEPAETETQTT